MNVAISAPPVHPFYTALGGGGQTLLPYSQFASQPTPTVQPFARPAVQPNYQALIQALRNFMPASVPYTQQDPSQRGYGQPAANYTPTSVSSVGQQPYDFPNAGGMAHSFAAPPGYQPAAMSHPMLPAILTALAAHLGGQ